LPSHLGADGSSLFLNLRDRSHEIISFAQLLEDGWAITKKKLLADLQKKSEDDDILEFYSLHEEPECVIIMPMPSRERLV
jgi:hypothetical protein